MKKKDAALLVFEAKDVLARVEKMGDLFAPVQTLKQKLPQLAGLAAGSEKEESENTSSAAPAKTRPRSKAATKTKGKSAAAKRRKL